MAEILNGEFIRNETNEKSMGGTEVLTMRLAERLDKEILDGVQIVSSRVRELQDDVIRIFWAHDLPGDPESEFIGTQHGQDKFHRFVFVSNWQMQGYIQRYNLPPSKCVVLRNFIDPIDEVEKTDDRINLIYHTTPHRGLNILAPVFDKLCEKYDNIYLDVYSSFALYGWDVRDQDFKQVFETLEKNPRVTNHGTKSNDDIRAALQKSHIFAYPTTWKETSCLCLIEAMSAKNVCVHSNIGGIFETASHWTNMYQYQEDVQQHAAAFYNMLDLTIENYQQMYLNTGPSKVYTDAFYSWENRKSEWTALLGSLKHMVVDKSLPVDEGPMFNYKTA
jgi:UDP-glucose:(glucosyl)LPS alpha-1,2-glucosyltransferase